MAIMTDQELQAMSIVGLIITVVVLIVGMYCIQMLMTKFNTPEPARTIIWVVLGLSVLGMLYYGWSSHTVVIAR